ncbi:MAG: response regulator [Candidatus Omnitrophica bacterium]|nr:response regulator [Candidatus Omnitrophota bacterium]
MNPQELKILVVDDDPGLLETLTDALELEGYGVTTARAGEEALQILDEEEVDLVITDIKMPGLSGMELLKVIKEKNQSLPVIVMTGFASLETAIEAIKQGAYDYITKPFEIEKLLHTVSKAVTQKKLEEKNKQLLEDLGDLNKKLEEKIGQIFALGEVSNIVTRIQDLDTILQAIIYISLEITGASKSAILLLDGMSKEFVVEYYKGFDSKLMAALRIKLGRGAIGAGVQKMKPISRKVLEENNLVLGKDEVELVGEGEFLIMPISYLNNIFGLLVVADFPEGKRVSDAEINILNILSRQASIAINNHYLYQKLQNKYLTTLEVLVSALEAKCKNTKGHSYRVGIYARKFAEFIKLSSDEISILEKACALHDIGKIVIPDYILSKPSKLSDGEMEQMRAHPLKGVEILVPLGIMKEIIPVVRNHHERFDGKGYPDCLKNGEIPFLAKLVTLADAFDAMTSLRSYRKALTSQEALAEIEANLGVQFDPHLGAQFIKFNPQIVL